MTYFDYRIQQLETTLLEEAKPLVWVEHFYLLGGSTIKETKDEEKTNYQPDNNHSGHLAGNILKHLETPTEKAGCLK